MTEVIKFSVYCSFRWPT